MTIRGGAVISETDATGKKMKTFVPANGTTLATQELLTVSGTTTEKLTFIHQDASGSSVQQTKADGTLNYAAGGRTGEYDALGRNVANASKFITLTVPPESKGGIDLFGTSAGYRPGGQIYRIDGLVATQSEFSDAINSGGIGGVFGLLEMSARISAREVLGYSVYSKDGRFDFADVDAAKSFAFKYGIGSVTRHVLLNTNYTRSAQTSELAHLIMCGAANNFTRLAFSRLVSKRCFN